MTATRIEPSTLASTLLEGAGRKRVLLAVAGPPAAGKSNFAGWLDRRLNEARPGFSAVLPMDGYHYDDVVLEARDRLARKGAPDTFDIDGFAAMLARLKADDGRPVAVPVFDRRLEIARAGGRIIEAGARIIVVEGNYLLLDEPDWAPLQAHFDMSVLLAPPLTVLEERLMRRWRDFGLSETDARRKVEQNDLPNCRLVLEGSRTPDFIIETARQNQP